MSETDKDNDQPDASFAEDAVAEKAKGKAETNAEAKAKKAVTSASTSTKRP